MIVNDLAPFVEFMIAVALIVIGFKMINKYGC
jgi:hypothetical protein